MDLTRLTILRQIVERGIAEENHEILDKYLIDHDLIIQGKPYAAKFKGEARILKKWFSDLHFELLDGNVIGEYAWARYKMSGTHHGEFLGCAPTGKSIKIDFYTILKIVDSIVVHRRLLPNRQALLKQIEERLKNTQ